MSRRRQSFQANGVGELALDDLKQFFAVHRFLLKEVLHLSDEQANQLTELELLERGRELSPDGRAEVQQLLEAEGRTMPVLMGGADRSGVLPKRIVRVVRLESWTHFVIEARNWSWPGGSNRERLFRGQGRADWSLSTEIERSTLLDALSVGDMDSVSRVVANMARQYLERFKELAVPTAPPQSRDFDESEWWTLGRHHGLLTPLLDWSRSPYVAAFFAFTQYSEKIARGSTHGALGVFPSPKANDYVGVWALSYDESLWVDGEFELVKPLSFGNARQTAQQGVLTQKSYLGVRSLEAYREGRNRADALTRIEIPATELPTALHDLYLMNINFGTLFPELEGAARQANFEPRTRQLLLPPEDPAGTD